MEFDRDALIARKPEVALIDELAHTNAPGCVAPKRFQDVLAVLRAGHRRHHDAQHSASRRTGRHDRAAYRNDRTRNVARWNPHAGRRGDSHRRHAGNAAPALARREDLSARTLSKRRSRTSSEPRISWHCASLHCARHCARAFASASCRRSSASCWQSARVPSICR